MSNKTNPITLTTDTWDKIVNTDTQNIDTNYVYKNITLITDAKKHRKNMPSKQLFKIQNAHIILITKGDGIFTINYKTYSLKSHMLICMPMGTFFSINTRSEDFNLKVLDWNISSLNKLFIIPRVYILSLSNINYNRINGYFILLHDYLNPQNKIRSPLNHFLVALVLDIEHIAKAETEKLKQQQTSAEILYEKFIQLLLYKWESLPRTVDFYAKQLSMDKIIG